MARAVVIVLLLALVIGFLALMLQAARVSRQQINNLDARVRTLIEVREAGAFGTGGFGGDNPVGEKGFTTRTLEKVHRIPHAHDFARVDDYVYTPQIDSSQSNAYAMVIGLRPGAALRAIGEVDYENARIIAGRPLRPDDDVHARVAVVGRLYAVQRLGLRQPLGAPLANMRILLKGQPYQVIGIYSTGNDFGDNHAFIPIEAFRSTFRPGTKLTKIFVTVDSVAHVARVVGDLKASIPEADVVTTPETVSAARSAVGSLAMASSLGTVLLFSIGAILVVFVMVLSTRERVREIGTLKAIGASNAEVAIQFLAEAVALSALGGIGAIIVAAFAAGFVQHAFGLPAAFDATVLLFIAISSMTFAALGSLYPVILGTRLSPVDAMRTT